jgi:ferrous iron transport protein B
MSVVIWFLQNFDSSIHMTENASESLLSSFGMSIAPLLKPLGFGTWQASVALLTGLIAKEAVVASLSIFYGFALTASSAEVAAAMAGFTPLSAFSFLVFVLLYVPCVAAVSTIYNEMNSAKYTVFSVLWQMLAAYAAAFAVYNLGLIFGL